jgi:hypothetical protein
MKRTLATTLTAILALALFTGLASAERQRPIVLGQTEGWVGGQLTVFDYSQNFVCTNAPLNDADCKVGEGFSALDLTGVQLDAADIPELIVITPFFTIDPGCAGAGCLEAFKAHPSVFVQCPETQSSAFAGGTAFGVFGHCVFHDTELDLAPLAGATIPTNAGPVTLGGKIPLPNHTHIVSETPGGSVPWKITVALVLDPALWPDANGGCTAGSGCLTSAKAVAAAAARGAAVGPVPTTLVLFFGVHGLHR